MAVLSTYTIKDYERFEQLLTVALKRIPNQDIEIVKLGSTGYGVYFGALEFKNLDVEVPFRVYIPIKCTGLLKGHWKMKSPYPRSFIDKLGAGKIKRASEDKWILEDGSIIPVKNVPNGVSLDMEHYPDILPGLGVRYNNSWAILDGLEKSGLNKGELMFLDISSPKITNEVMFQMVSLLMQKKEKKMAETNNSPRPRAAANIQPPQHQVSAPNEGTVAAPAAQAPPESQNTGAQLQEDGPLVNYTPDKETQAEGTISVSPQDGPTVTTNVPMENTNTLSLGPNAIPRSASKTASDNQIGSLEKKHYLVVDLWPFVEKYGDQTAARNTVLEALAALAGVEAPAAEERSTGTILKDILSQLQDVIPKVSSGISEEGKEALRVEGETRIKNKLMNL